MNHDSTTNETFFIWQSVTPHTFPRSLDTASLYSTEPIWEKFSMCQLWVSKNFFWDLKSKIRSHSFVRLDQENKLNIYNMVISFELKAKKNIWWKNQKTLLECPFEIIGFKCWPKLFWWKIWCLSFLKPCHMLFCHSQNILKFLVKIHHFLCTKLCENPNKKFFIDKFLKSIVIWRPNDFGDQKVSNGPLKPHICCAVTNILHTYTI